MNHGLNNTPGTIAATLGLTSGMKGSAEVGLVEDQIRVRTAQIAARSREAGVKPDVADEPGRALLIDFDGFFKSLVEMGAHPVSEALGALPLDDIVAARAQTYVRLFDSAMWFPRQVRGHGFRAARTVWWTLALKSAVVAASGRATGADEWAAFYAADLHDFVRAKYPVLKEVKISLTLSRRLVARTHLPTRTIYLSAVTRTHLMAINLALANYAELVVEDGRTLSRADSREFFEFTLEQSLPLHRPLQLATSIVSPHRRSAATFAQRITQIQMAFLALHEYGHFVVRPDTTLSFEEVELNCDDFAFENLAAGGTPDWMQFLAVRWLFEVLAFDRVLSECLASQDGRWAEIDWLQLELRNRRPIERFPEWLPRVLSPYENAGSLFLLDLKGWLCDLGPEYLQARLELARRSSPLLTGAEFSAMARQQLLDIPDTMYRSAAQTLEDMQPNDTFKRPT